MTDITETVRKLRALLAASSLDPWSAEMIYAVLRGNVKRPEFRVQARADAEFTAAARNHMGELLDEIELRVMEATK